MAAGELDALPVKDPDAAHPVATVWRPALRAVVHALVEGDFGLARGCAGVGPVSARTEEQMRTYVAAYGMRLVDLPDDTWTTSVAQWMEGYWDVLVDLWTAEEGRSDMVLLVRIRERGDGFHLDLLSLHVP